MSDYTQITDFGAKDGLASGNPSKLIVGAEHDAEFNAISTAIATKYDSDDLATQAQAEGGTDNATLMTPLRTAQFYDAQGAAGATTKLKASDETVNNSSALQADDDLTGWNLDATSRYRVNGFIVVSLKSASDLKIALRFSSAPTSAVCAFGGKGDGITSGDYQLTDVDQAVVITDTDNVVLVPVDGFVVSNAATTLEVQWAQSSAQVEDTILQQGSYLTVIKVS